MCTWNMLHGTPECKTKAEGLPQLLGIDKNLSSSFTLQNSIQSLGRGTKPPATPKGDGQRPFASPAACPQLPRHSGGPARLPSCAPKAAAMFSWSAGARGAERADGLP